MASASHSCTPATLRPLRLKPLVVARGESLHCRPDNLKVSSLLSGCFHAHIGENCKHETSAQTPEKAGLCSNRSLKRLTTTPGETPALAMSPSPPTSPERRLRVRRVTAWSGPLGAS